ncbi:acetate uptake transporter [Conexibacter arvalis]|uniref:GPR1/FUN34/yaaH family protein n=1 Tax=Conexibacter arvalis TaxID=912552 RepID=A0A840IBT3_9ACTN|nr:acetate uptake transporter [Conexibacter arvalis]MBB4662387.1 hypothetical protein [Conexibacter arvalis]
MSAITPDQTGIQRHDGHRTIEGWRDNTRVFLQPIAAPSILGLFGFAGATFIVAAHLARWYGTTTSPEFLFPFAAFFGGLAQFAAGMWAYRARDGLATAMHGMWGAFWMAFGLLFLLGATGTLTIPTGTFTELGFWFLALAAITFSGSIAAMAVNLSLTGVLTTLWVGAGLLAVGYLTGASTWLQVGGWVLIASAALAWYTASAMMLESTFGRVVLPLGARKREANVPGHIAHQTIEFELGEPGVRHGQ